MPRQPPAKPTRDEAARERRALIVEAAAGCFIAKGFHQTGIREIAKAAGISLGNLYNHFTGKPALIAEIAKVEAEELQPLLQGLNQELPPPRALERFVDDLLDHTMQQENAELAVEIMAEALRNPEIGAAFDVNRRRLTKALSDLLKRGIRTGAFDPDLDCKEAPGLILDAIESLALRAAFPGGRVTKAARRALQAMLRKFVCAG